MPPTHRVRPPLRRVVRGDDRGFTIVESLVSFVMLAVVSATACVLIIDYGKASKTSGDRTTAANLAQQSLQDATALRFPAYPKASTTTSVVNGTTYTVARSVSYTRSDNTVVAECPATPDFTNRPYMVATATVTWPPAGASDRVVMATEIAC